MHKFQGEQTVFILNNFFRQFRAKYYYMISRDVPVNETETDKKQQYFGLFFGFAKTRIIFV